MWIERNENPLYNRVGDCVIRAISTALNQEWVKTYADFPLSIARTYRKQKFKDQ